MVRKWSYLTSSHRTHTGSKDDGIYNFYVFKVFRVTTRFKKYRRYKTTFVRKKDKLRKKNTNWINLLRIFAHWSTVYLKSRYLIRTYQMLYISQYNCVLYNLNFFHKLILTHTELLYFNTTFLHKKRALFRAPSFYH